MNRFTHRIVICLVPVVVSAIIVVLAYLDYMNGKGGFRMGVDLAGGTILVYEVDETKMPENFKAEDLAAALKRRIDPADLYNITIRPVQGSPPRVEIILPTGGKHQAEAEQRNWEKVLEKVNEKYKADNPYTDVEPKNFQALVDAIVARADENVDRADVEEWLKGKRSLAWNKLVEEATREYPNERLGAYAALKNKRGRKGDLVDLVIKLHPKDNRDDAAEFVEKLASPGRSKDRQLLTGDKVEEIKNLIEKQGRLEFRILANREDDAPAIKAAEDWIKDPAHRAELERLELRAEPPPPPRNPDDNTLFFPVNLPNEPAHTYSWVELAKSELYSLKLNSQALEANPALKAQVEKARKNRETFTLPGIGGGILYTREITTAGWARRDREQYNLGKRDEYFILVRDPEKGKEISGDYLVRASEGQSAREGGRRSIDFQFNSEGGNLFYEITSKNKPRGDFHRHLAIVFDGQVTSAPTLNEPIRTHGQITGDFEQQEVIDYVRLLRAGALPATLKKDPVSQNTMSSTLGEETIYWGTRSVLWAFVAVMAFMVFYYRFAGLVACVALLANLLLTIAFMVLVQAAFTLPGLAGLVLMLGMAVDANVLIYERLREERERGATLALAIRNGYDRAFPTIIDTHLSSIFTAIVLYVVGNDQLKGFGISLTVGLIISLFTSLYMTRTIFEIWLYKGWMKELNFFGGLVRLIHARYWDFMSIRYYWFTATIALTVLGGGLFIYRLDRGGLNIDFVGGTALMGRLSEPMSLHDLREALEKDSTLPDLSLGQDFHSREQTELRARGEERDADGRPLSSYFTIRTAERNPQLVFDYVNDRLGDKLKRILLGSYAINKAGNQVTLRFTNQQGEKDFASPAQVQSLLTDEFRANNLPRSAFSVDRRGEDVDGHFAELLLRLNEPVDTATLQGILKSVQEKFASRPQPERLENFDKRLAGNTQERALYAILASWAAILLYLWFRFGSWTFGAATVLCLIHDLFFTLGVIAGSHYLYQWFGPVLGIRDFKIDLDTVAALLTLVGYSVSDTIVVFDRIREVRGKNPALTPKIINDSVNQTLTRTLLSSTTVFVVVIVLYAFGGEGVKLFAFVMIVGVIVGTYSSIYIASPLLLIFGEGKLPAGQAERAAQAAAARE
jgi:SecD/SecF fusion protein